jgi:hypothetical protein
MLGTELRKEVGGFVGNRVAWDGDILGAAVGATSVALLGPKVGASLSSELGARFGAANTFALSSEVVGLRL